MERSSFFNSVNGDRRYKAESFALYFSTFIGNGVFPNPSTNLQVIANNDMTVTVKKGFAWINGYMYENTDDLTIKVDIADGVLNRIDRVVLRLDFLSREIKLNVKKGKFASTGVASILQRDADAYELGLADLKISKGTISITQADITDTRLNKSLCGIVHGMVEQVDTTAIFNQFQSWYSQTQDNYDKDIGKWTTDKKQEFNKWYAENTTAFFEQWKSWFNPNTTKWTIDFETWFESIKDALGNNISGNLLNKINELAGFGRTTETVKENADKIDSLSDELQNLEIGGLNILKNSSAGIYLTESDRPTGRTHEVLGNGNGLITVTNEKMKLSAYLFIAPDYIDRDIVKESGNFTFSMSVKTSTDKFYMQVRCRHGNNNIVEGNANIPNTDGSWMRVSATMKVPNDKLHRSNISLGIFGELMPVGSTIEYKDFKLERGNKATDWTPHPEDLAGADRTTETVKGNADNIRSVNDDINDRWGKVGKDVTGTDLNNLIETGFYCFHNNTINKPRVSFGYLEVRQLKQVHSTAPKNIYQKVIDFINCDTYERRRVNNNWHAWELIPSKSDLDKKIDKSGDTFTGIAKAQPNVSYTTAQMRNIILSPTDPVLSQMKEGEIWFKYR